MNKPLKIWVCIWNGQPPTVHRNRQTIIDILFSDGIEEHEIDINEEDYIYIDDYLRAQLIDLED